MTLTASAQSLPPAPVAPLMPKELVAHGHHRTDPWYGLRERDNGEVLDYLKAENAYADAAMAPTKKLQKKLYKEILGRIQESDSSVPYKDGNYCYYTRMFEGKNYSALCRYPFPFGEETVLVDENERAEGHDFYDLGDWQISPNGRYLALSEDFEGDETYQLHILDLETGNFLPDMPEEICGWGTEWIDDTHLLYVLMDDAMRPFRVLRHTLGTSIEDDVEVYREQDERFTVWVSKTQDNRYVLIGSANKNTADVHLLDSSDPEGVFKPFLPRKEGVEYYVDHHSKGFVVLSNEHARNFKVLLYPENGRSESDATVLIAHDERVRIRETLTLRRHLVTLERNYGQDRIRVIDLDSREEHFIEMPDKVYMLDLENNAEFVSDVLRFTYESPITPSTVYDYQLDSRELTLLKRRQIPVGFDPQDYVAERCWAPVRDGTEVPVTLIYRKGLEITAATPLLVYGYGAYGDTMDPYFSSSRFSLIDRGFVYAVAHIRGGGLLGQDWYEAGKFFNKKNTFTDFIDVTEWLHAQGYSCSGRTAMMGGSAGGLLMGAVLNMRPDLYAVCVAQVPFVDVVTTMLDPSIPLTTLEYDEWGNPEDEAYYRYMLEYSPYDNVKAQAYPNLLVEAGLNDSRVQYWEPSKWVAKLRTTKTDDNLLLLKVNMDAGHGGASGRYEYIKEVAFEYAFILHCLGISK